MRRTSRSELNPALLRCWRTDLPRRPADLDFYKKYQGETPTLDLGEPFYCWALLFDLPPPDEVKFLEETFEEGKANFFGDPSDPDYTTPQFMCAEAVELVQRFWSADLEVEMSVSSNSNWAGVICWAGS